MYTYMQDVQMDLLLLDTALETEPHSFLWKLASEPGAPPGALDLHVSRLTF